MDQKDTRERLTKTVAEALPGPSDGKPYVVHWCPDLKGFGVRVMASGVRSWIVEGRLHREGPSKIRRTIGRVDDMAADYARAQAKRLLGDIKDGIDPLAEARAKSAKRAQERAEATAKGKTLGDLMEAYAAALKATGKPSWRDVLSLCRNHVPPKLWTTPAVLVTPADIDDLLADVRGRHARTSEKLKAYLHAAYRRGRGRIIGRGTVATLGSEFRIDVNPAAGVTFDEAPGVDKNPFTMAEARAYWTALQGVDGAAAAGLRLHVLTGGQRLSQLMRATLIADKGVLRLIDTKGRRAKAREHIVPLLAEARADWAIVEQARPAPGTLSNEARRLFGRPRDPAVDGLPVWTGRRRGKGRTRDGSRDAPRPQRINEWQPKRIRSAVETELAARGISDEIRGRLLSHGVAGVQSTNYNAWQYLPEKTAALRQWVDLVLATD